MISYSHSDRDIMKIIKGDDGILWKRCDGYINHLNKFRTNNDASTSSFSTSSSPSPPLPLAQEVEEEEEDEDDQG